MTEETVEQKKPHITIDGVEISVDELSARGQVIFGRLVRVINKEINAGLDLEEYRASKLHYENLIKSIYNEDKAPAVNGEGEEESSSESDEDSE